MHHKLAVAIWPILLCAGNGFPVCVNRASVPAVFNFSEVPSEDESFHPAHDCTAFPQGEPSICSSFSNPSL